MSEYSGRRNIHDGANITPQSGDTERADSERASIGREIRWGTSGQQAMGGSGYTTKPGWLVARASC